ncbi:hypothetical protein I79_006199 [Cricetulus griseus]|uniref:Uncharacterized protein n=1 Tax=Cricetulus griseus TaxID=10029 RepID=G3H772_CRIGR|nr:hypothetical protein I79_006199 [Cricetulus griseus]
MARDKYRVTMGKHKLVSWEKPTGSGQFQETLCLEVNQNKAPPPRTESPKAEFPDTFRYIVSSWGKTGSCNVALANLEITM